MNETKELKSTIQVDKQNVDQLVEKNHQLEHDVKILREKTTRSIHSSVDHENGKGTAHEKIILEALSNRNAELEVYIFIYFPSPFKI